MGACGSPQAGLVPAEDEELQSAACDSEPSGGDSLARQGRAPGNPYLFLGKMAGQPLNNPQQCFNRALKQTGIGDFRIHDLRHTHASIAINNGTSLYEVQNLLGHSQAKITTRYAHLANETLQRVSDKVSKTILNAIG